MTTTVEHSCSHCGLPVTRRARSAGEALYCCYGCEVAAEIVGTGEEGGARLTLYKLGIGIILGINVMMFSMPLYVESLGSFFQQGFGSASFFSLLKWLLMVISLPVYFMLGFPFIESSIRDIKGGLKVNADLLIALGVTAAMLVSIFDTIFESGPVYYETAVAILIIVTVGRYLEAKARFGASKTIEQLDKQVPSMVSIIGEDGLLRDVSVASLSPGMVIVSKPGEMIPVDCRISDGVAMISEAMLTGEPAPKRKSKGDALFAGAVNYDGLLHLEVLQPAEKSFIQRLRTLLLESKLRRAPIQDVADKIAAIAIPVIIAIAMGSLIYWWIAAGFSKGLFAFLSVVLIACPCAIGIATPTALWMAVTRASKQGILFRSLGVLERLAGITTIFFDKTGTVTKGIPSIDSVTIIEGKASTSEKALVYAATVASFSNHPLSKALANKYPHLANEKTAISSFEEIPGSGILATIGTASVRLGSEQFVTNAQPTTQSQTAVWAKYQEAGSEEVIFKCTASDTLREEVASVFKTLHDKEYRTVILSGDRSAVVDDLSEELNCEAMAELAPEDKARIVTETPDAMFVGDGFNDAGAIGAAQVGVAVGSSSDLLRTEADVILFDNDLSHVPALLELAKKTMRVVKQNLFWAFAYNVIGVVLAAFGVLNPIIAAVAMALSSFFVTQNSFRLKSQALTMEGGSHA